ncbi:MAG: hypothetical protein JWR59_1653 [Brevundimonas sp.]|nr:hypothetical protein [Brevundimonas sp.]
MTGWSIGIGGSDHDFSAVLAQGCDIRVAIEQERISRIRYGETSWFRDPIAAPVDYCLASEGIGLDEIETLVGTDTLPARVRSHWRGRSIELYPHHLCHAASAYLMLPPDTRAGILVYDGYGSIDRDHTVHGQTRRETVSLWRFTADGPERIGSAWGASTVEDDDFPLCVDNSIGMFYEMLTGMLGYAPMDAGKTMGLAAFGIPCHIEMLEQFIQYRDDPADCFRCDLSNPDLVREIDRALLAKGGGFAARADLAASGQLMVERSLAHFLRFFDGLALDAIAISGGCALNSVANGRLAQRIGHPLFVPPHSGDAGLGFGALWVHAQRHAGANPHFSFRGGPTNPGLSRPGRAYEAHTIADAVAGAYPHLARDASVSSPGDLAQLVAQGAIIGVFNGSSEFGPRALGGRSLIADPRNPGVRERINREIKGREPFRPLAPMVLASRSEAYFGTHQGDAFMLNVVDVEPCGQRAAPAATHVDGSARVQRIDDAQGDPFLIQLLQAFEQLTGVGMLLNTSFNRRGEPIVETPADAVDAFIGMRLDGLYLQGEFYRLT